MSNLSPAAQAVMNGLWGADLDCCQSIEDIRRRQAAAVLRAAADRVPDPQMSAHMLYAIADELEGAQ